MVFVQKGAAGRIIGTRGKNGRREGTIQCTRVCEKSIRLVCDIERRKMARCQSLKGSILDTMRGVEEKEVRESASLRRGTFHFSFSLERENKSRIFILYYMTDDSCETSCTPMLNVTKLWFCKFPAIPHG